MMAGELNGPVGGACAAWDLTVPLLLYSEQINENSQGIGSISGVSRLLQAFHSSSIPVISRATTISSIESTSVAESHLIPAKIPICSAGARSPLSAPFCCSLVS